MERMDSEGRFSKTVGHGSIKCEFGPVNALVVIMLLRNTSLTYMFIAMFA